MAATAKAQTQPNDIEQPWTEQDPANDEAELFDPLTIQALLDADPEFAVICDQRRARWIDALEHAQQEPEFDEMAVIGTDEQGL